MLKRFPNPVKLVTLNKTKMHLLAINGKLPKSAYSLRRDGLPKKDFSVGGERLGGGIQVGHKDAWMRWNEAFYDTARRLAPVWHFIGDDQAVMAGVAVMYPELVQLIYPKSYFNNSGSDWFYLQYYFSWPTLILLNKLPRVSQWLVSRRVSVR